MRRKPRSLITLSRTPARILVILEPHPEIARLFRAAKRRAQQHGLEWEVLLIETPKMYRGLDVRDRENLLNATTLAEQMGAIVSKQHARSMLKGIQNALIDRVEQRVPIHSIIVADVKRKLNWFGLGRRPLVRQLKSTMSPEIDIVAIPIGAERIGTRWLANILRVNTLEILISLLTVAIATVAIEMVNYFAPEVIGPHNRNKSLIYMIACAFAAGRYGLLAGIVTSVASFLMLNLIYVSPYMRLEFMDRTSAVNMGLFLLAAVILSLLGSRDYGNRQSLSKRVERLQSLLKVHRSALTKNRPEEAIMALNDELKTLFGGDIVFFLPSILDEYKLETLFQEELMLNEGEQKALQVCWEEGKTTGIGAPYHPPGCGWRFEPLTTTKDEVGVLGLRIGDNKELDADFGQLLSGIADQVAMILERLQLRQNAEETKIQAEREKLRAMLLSSVSHDLKTPLASIIGSLSVYRSMGPKLPEEHRLTLIATALDEAQRLDSFITNILDMTRIESGQIELKAEWVRPDEWIQEVRRRLRDQLRNHELVIHTPGTRAEVSMDAMMTGQVLQNLLDNAAKYNHPGTRIEVTWNTDKSGFVLSVRDHGVGIPEEQLDKVFDKYARIKRQDRQVAGTGLGLAIAKAVMQAQGGTITAANHPEGGAIFTIFLPKTRNAGNRRAA